MVTKARKLSEKPKTAYDTSSSNSLIAEVVYEGKKFSLRSRWHPELYNEYINRKNINVDFSGAETTADIEKLRRQFAKRFADAPTPEQLLAAKAAHDTAYKNETDGFLIQEFARNITFDLEAAGSDTRVSNARYLQIVDYIKSAIRAVAGGKSIDSVHDTTLSPIQRTFNKIIGNDPLANTKRYINEYLGKDRLAKLPRESLLALSTKIPTERITSRVLGNSGPIDEYMEYFDTIARKNMDTFGKEYTKFTILLFKDKIRTDGMRTFDVMAAHHMNKLKKEKNKLDALILNEATRKMNQRRGLARQRNANMYGPVDPVARSIAKMKRTGLERK